MGKTSKESTSDMTVEQKFVKMEPIEHILKKSDTYVGSIKNKDEDMYIYDDEEERIITKNINYNPGFYKICDEAIVNARDQTIREPTCDFIKVNVD